MSTAHPPRNRLLALVVALTVAPACDGLVAPDAAPAARATSAPLSRSFAADCGEAPGCPALEVAAARPFVAPPLSALPPSAPPPPAATPWRGESHRAPRPPAAEPGAAASACGLAGWATPSRAELPIPEDVRSFDHLGLSVALDGRFLAAGADGDDALGADAGAAWVYERDAAGAFLPSEPLVASDGGPGDHLGWRLDLDGGVLAIAAPRHAHAGGFETGAVYVFELIDGAWSEVAELVAPVTREAGFGESVRVRGDQILVGAPRDDARGAEVGAAFLYERGADGVWALAARLDPRAARPGARVGTAVALARGLAVVGGEGADGGAAWIFGEALGQWREEARLAPPDRGAGARVGAALDCDGRTLLVGGPGQELDGAAEVGAVWAYVLEGGQWQPRGRFTPPGLSAGAHFGGSVRVDGELAAVGAWGARERGVAAGALWLAAGKKGVWAAGPRLVEPRGAADDRLGLTVAFRDGLLVAGLWGADTVGPDAGKVLVFAPRACDAAATTPGGRPPE